MMSLTSNDNNDVPLHALDTEEEVLQDCARCNQQFVAKYWDSELDWYIEVNTTSYCRECASN